MPQGPDASSPDPRGCAAGSETSTAERPAVEADHEIEFIKAMIEWTRDDVRRVHVRVTAALAMAALFITAPPFGKLAALDQPHKNALLVGLLCLLLAAGLHFLYVSKVHRSSRDLACFLRNGDGDAAGTLWEGIWKRWNWAFNIGDFLIAIGLALLGVAFLGLLDLPPGAGETPK